MNEWYHSGIEGYCKAAADLFGSRKDGDSVLGLCRDLLPDRVSGANLSHAWAMSNLRNGDRKCRQKVFEMLWLNEVRRDTYREEAEMLAMDRVPADGFKTILPGSSYEANLKACKDAKKRATIADRQYESRSTRAATYIEEANSYLMNEETRDEYDYRTIHRGSRYAEGLNDCDGDDEAVEREAIAQCERDALDRCVQHVIELARDDGESEASSIISLLLTEDFPVRFFVEVVPAIERGFLSERYRSFEVQRFLQVLNSLIFNAHNSLFSEGELDVKPLNDFVTTLFAGLVYGPSHRLALNLADDDTTFRPSWKDNGDDYDGPEGTTIRLTQLFDPSGSHTGSSDLFRPSQVVLFGRGSNLDEYIERYNLSFPGVAGSIETVMQEHDVTFFPTVLHPAVGVCHGMLLFEGDAWWYYDLGSKNGTSVASKDEFVNVNRLLKIKPGDVLRLGAPASATGRDVYLTAATVAVTSHVDLTEDLV